jgi:hypothetical protein
MLTPLTNVLLCHFHEHHEGVHHACLEVFNHARARDCDSTSQQDEGQVRELGATLLLLELDEQEDDVQVGNRA